MRAFAAVLVVGLVVARVASAASFEDLGDHVTVRSDGGGSLAYQRGEGASPVHVFSEGPTGTTQRDVPVPAGCSFSAVGADEVAFDCFNSDSGPPGPRLVDVVSGTPSTPPGVAALMRYERENDANGESYFINALGSRMLGIGVSGNHVDGELYLDRRTGKVIPFVVQTPRTAPSLDVPAGRVRLCAPLRRPRDLFVEFIDEFREPVPATYQAPYLTYRWRGSVILRRCGTTRKLVLGHSPEDEPLLTHRFVAWQTERALHVFSLRTQATANLKLPSPRVLCANADDRYVVCRGADDHAWLADLGDTGRVRATRRPPPR